MKLKNVLAAAASSLLLVTAPASFAAAVIDFSPTATNGGAGAIGTAANFSAVGFQSNLSSTLTVFGNAGVSNYVETGVITITSFRDAGDNQVVSGVGTDYTLQAAFSLSGSGTWAGTAFTAAPGGLFNVDLWANGIGGIGSQLIGTASLDPSSPQFALAIAFGSVAPGSVGVASTTLTATLLFTPTAGYEGPGGFFQNTPLNLNLAIGNAGGNTLNTGYSVDAAGNVTFITPTPGANQGTANVTFDRRQIPEPGALALVSIALLAGGLVSARSRRAKNV